MIKEKFILLINICIKVLCFLFVLSSFFCAISYTPIEKIAFSDKIVMTGVFVSGIVLSLILGERLNQVFLILRFPVSEWKERFLK